MDQSRREPKGCGRAHRKAQGADLAVAYRMEGAGSTVDTHYLPGVRATLFDDGAFTRPDTPEHGKLTLWFLVFHFFMFGIAEDRICQRTPVILRAYVFQ